MIKNKILVGQQIKVKQLCCSYLWFGLGSRAILSLFPKAAKQLPPIPYPIFQLGNIFHGK